MKLNPTKCAFFIKGGKFLGYMVKTRGIEPNSNKVKVFLEMPESTYIRNVQRLMGNVIALNRFMSKSVEKCLPFFRKLRKSSNFKWKEECWQAFAELKGCLSSPKVLRRPIGQEDLYIYLAAFDQAVSVVLVPEKHRVQKLIFCVSKVLKGAEIRYPNVEKAALTLLLAIRKFKVYLENHQGIIVTDLPLQRILHRLKIFGQMLAWSIEIGPYYLKYRPRTAIKAQALAECSFNEGSSETKEGAE